MRKWILSSEAAPYTEGDWLGENGEIVVGHAFAETLLKSGIRVLALRATRGEYFIDVNIDERQAKKLVGKISAAFGMNVIDADTEKRIEELEETIARQAIEIEGLRNWPRVHGKFRTLLGATSTESTSDVIKRTMSEYDELKRENENLRKALEPGYTEDV